MQLSAAIYSQYAGLSLLIVGGLVTASAWAFVVKSVDKAARSWFAAIVMQLISGTVLFSAGTNWAEASNFLAPIVFFSSLYVALHSITLLLGIDARRYLFGLWGLQLIVFTILNLALDMQELSVIFAVSAAMILEILIVWSLGQVRIRMNLMATLFAEAAYSAAFLGGLTRLLGSALSGNLVMYTDLSVYSVVAMSLQGVLIVMSCFFCIGVSIQRSETREMAFRLEADQLRVQQRLLEEHSRETKKLIAERDRMMILNSRYSTVSTLSLLGAGVVHEIAQPLQAARSAMDVFVLRGPMPPDALAIHTNAVIGLIDRASNVVENLRRLIREESVEMEDIDCENLLRRVYPIFSSEAKRRSIAATLVMDETAAGKHVRANAVMLERVLFNLAVNALEALDEVDSAGSVPARNRKLLIDIRTTSLSAGEAVVIGFHDTGHGIDHAAYDQIFEMLTSTKDQGIGLGLYLVKTFLESWGGTVKARPNRYECYGTSIELTLPIIAAHQRLLATSRF